MNQSLLSRRASAAGFTLIETLVVLAIAGILSSIAYPSFASVMHKVHRSDALVAMMQIRLVQERFRADNPSYGTLADIGVSSNSAARHYTLSVTEHSQNGFEAIAEATGAQQADASCRVLKLTLTGVDVGYASGPDRAALNPDSVNRQCWRL